MIPVSSLFIHFLDTSFNHPQETMLKRSLPNIQGNEKDNSQIKIGDNQLNKTCIHDPAIQSNPHVKLKRSLQAVLL